MAYFPKNMQPIFRLVDADMVSLSSSSCPFQHPNEDMEEQKIGRRMENLRREEWINGRTEGWNGRIQWRH